ncbi:MAG: hypothetical protein R3D01_07640 [Hyphomicrobiales bacterium]
MLFGDAGDDLLDPGAGDDTVDGGAGTDDHVSYEFTDATGGIFYEGGTGSNGIAIGDAEISGDASIGTDQITGVEIYSGTDFADVFVGGDASESIFGLGGDDDIDGGAGDDVLIGDAGDDTLTGGAGEDVFIFGDGSGNDTITDFEAGAGAGDVLDLLDFGFGTFANVVAAATDIGSDLLIQLDGDDSVTLLGVNVADLDQDDVLV